MIPSGFPVFWVAVPGCSRNGSWASSYFRVQKKFVELWRSTQNMWLRLTNFPKQFFSNPPFYFLWYLGDVLFSHTGTNVFCDWPFLALSCVSLETAPKFRLFLSVAIMQNRENFNSFEDWIRIFYLNSKRYSNGVLSPLSEGKGFNQYKQLKKRWSRISLTILRAAIQFNNNSTFVSPIYTFSSARNIIVYTPIQGTNREKYFNHNIYKGKMPTLAGNKHLSVHFFFRRAHLLHLSTEKCTCLIRQKWTSKCLFPRRHKKIT